MKKNTKKIVFLLLIALVAIGSYIVVGTYAKYTSESTGTSTARVAVWNVKLNGNKISDSSTFTFSLFDTLKEEDTSTTEEHVAAANGTDLVIAPGTGGSFDIVLLNQSEVDATYAIDYTVSNDGDIPVEFSIDGSTWTTTLADVEADETDTLLSKNSTANQDETTITVYWRWPFDGADSDNYSATQDDEYDTDLGTASTLADITVTAVVTATQID